MPMPTASRPTSDAESTGATETPGAGDSTAASMLTCGDVGRPAIAHLLDRFGLTLGWTPDDQAIPGSHWGAPEAGILGTTVHARADTPVHSLLHEACHTICMDTDRRAALDTDAGGTDLEESGVCYLQILLADHLPGASSTRLMTDMDAWGYSFRLGSTQAWFEEDAEDARAWLLAEGLIDPAATPTFRVRSP